MKLRRYRVSDCSELTRLFYDTVHSVCARDYTPEQLDARILREFESGKNKQFKNVIIVLFPSAPCAPMTPWWWRKGDGSWVLGI